MATRTWLGLGLGLGLGLRLGLRRGLRLRVWLRVRVRVRSPLMATRTTTSIGPNFSNEGVLQVISVLEMYLPATTASRLPSENLTCTRSG
jgi:hypothetical protein